MTNEEAGTFCPVRFASSNNPKWVCPTTILTPAYLRGLVQIWIQCSEVYATYSLTKWIVSQGEKVPWNRKPTPPLHNPQKWGLSIWVSLAAFQLSTLAVTASPFPSCLHFVLLCFFNMSVPISLFLLHLDSKSSLRVSFLHSVTIIGPCYRQCCELQDSKSGFSTVFNIVM